MISLRELARRMSEQTGMSEAACRARLRRHGRQAQKILIELQDDCCAICGAGGKLVIDHDHMTGEIRGLLCNNCNTGLGMFKDSTIYLNRAIGYLKSPPAQGWQAQPTPVSLGSVTESTTSSKPTEVG